MLRKWKQSENKQIEIACSSPSVAESTYLKCFLRELKLAIAHACIKLIVTLKANASSRVVSSDELN